MRNMTTIARRELISIFCSPLAYGILTAYLLLMGLGFILAKSAQPPMATLALSSRSSTSSSSSARRS